MAEKSLMDYIDDVLNKGYSEDDLIDMLKEAGYADDEISEGLKEFTDWKKQEQKLEEKRTGIKRSDFLLDSDNASPQVSDDSLMLDEKERARLKAKNNKKRMLGINTISKSPFLSTEVPGVKGLRVSSLVSFFIVLMIIMTMGLLGYYFVTEARLSDELDAGIPTIETVLTIEEIDAVIERGEQGYVNSKLLFDSKSSLDSLINLDSDNALLLKMRGRIFLMADDRSRAKADMMKAVGSDQTCSECISMLAYISYLEGDLTTTLSLIEKAIPLEEDKVSKDILVYERAIVNMLLGRPEKAVPDLKAVIKRFDGLGKVPEKRYLLFSYYALVKAYGVLEDFSKRSPLMMEALGVYEDLGTNPFGKEYMTPRVQQGMVEFFKGVIRRISENAANSKSSFALTEEILRGMPLIKVMQDDITIPPMGPFEDIYYDLFKINGNDIDTLMAMTKISSNSKNPDLQVKYIDEIMEKAGNNYPLMHAKVEENANAIFSLWNEELLREKGITSSDISTVLYLFPSALDSRIVFDISKLEKGTISESRMHSYFNYESCPENHQSEFTERQKDELNDFLIEFDPKIFFIYGCENMLEAVVEEFSLRSIFAVIMNPYIPPGIEKRIDVAPTLVRLPNMEKMDDMVGKYINEIDDLIMIGEIGKAFNATDGQFEKVNILTDENTMGSSRFVSFLTTDMLSKKIESEISEIHTTADQFKKPTIIQEELSDTLMMTGMMGVDHLKYLGINQGEMSGSGGVLKKHLILSKPFFGDDEKTLYDINNLIVYYMEMTGEFGDPIENDPSFILWWQIDLIRGVLDSNENVDLYVIDWKKEFSNQEGSLWDRKYGDMTLDYTINRYEDGKSELI